MSKKSDDSKKKKEAKAKKDAEKTAEKEKAIAESKAKREKEEADRLEKEEEARSKKQADAVIEQKAGKAGTFDPKKPCTVRHGCAITCRRGVVGGGKTVLTKDVIGGNETLKKLVEVNGILVQGA